MHRRVLEGKEKLFGPDHPNTLFNVDNLGITVEYLGQSEKPKAMFRQALRIREKTLGPDHPDTLLNVGKLGDVLQSRGEYEKAESMYRSVREGWEKVLGPIHPDIPPQCRLPSRHSQKTGKARKS